MRAALLLTVGVLVLEVVGGIISGSLALLADAAHMFTDVAALTLAWAGMALGDRAPTRRHTFGLARGRSPRGVRERAAPDLAAERGSSGRPGGASSRPRPCRRA